MGSVQDASSYMVIWEGFSEEVTFEQKHSED